MIQLREYKRTKARPDHHRRGIVLVIVMVVIVMVSLAGFGFVASMSSENKAVHLRGEQLQMEYAIASAEEMLKQSFEKDAATETSRQPLPTTQATDDESTMRGVVISEDGPHSRIRFSVMAPRFDETGMAPWKYGLERESNKLNLRSIMNWEASMPGSGRRALMALPGITESIADAILDWMDSDNIARQSGAETDYYATLNPPYSPRNGIPDSMEELLLIKGITRSMLFGRDADQNHRIDVDELSGQLGSAPRDFDGERPLPLTELLTLYGGERNQSADGKPRINLNQFNLVQLQREVTEAFDPELAKYVVLFRQFGLANSKQKPADLKTLSVNLALPPRFTFRSPLELIQSQVLVVNPTGGPVVVTSPLAGESDKLDDVLKMLYDRLTVIPLPLIQGRVNLNGAPAEVLRAIPGFDKALAEQVVAARTGTSKQDQRHEEHPCWLMTEGIVDLNKMKELLPYLTVGGDVYRTQIVAFSESSRISQRVELVLDATVKPARRVYWKDLQVLGRGYPWDAIDTPGGITTSETGASDAAPSRY